MSVAPKVSATEARILADVYRYVLSCSQTKTIDDASGKDDPMRATEEVRNVESTQKTSARNPN